MSFRVSRLHYAVISSIGEQQMPAFVYMLEDPSGGAGKGQERPFTSLVRLRDRISEVCRY